MKRNRFICPIVLITLLLILAGCSPLYLMRSQGAYERGVQAYYWYLKESDATIKEVYKEKAIENLKKALEESESVMKTDPTSDKGYLFYLKASIILSGLDYDNSQSYIEDAFTVSRAFRLKTMGQKKEALGAYWFAKCAAGWEEADRRILSEALAAVEYALENLDPGPEKAESASVRQILEFRILQFQLEKE